MEPARGPRPEDGTQTTDRRGRKLAPKTIATRQRNIQAVQLKAAGYTLQEIVDRLGFSTKARAWETIQRTVDRHEIEAVDDYREISIARLDMALKAIWPYALGLHPSQQTDRKPDLAYLDRVLVIERERSRLLGLYMPEQIDVRAFIMKMADAEGFTDDEKADAVEFVEHHLRELRAGGN